MEYIKFQILKTQEFEDWFSKQSDSIKTVVLLRILKIAEFGYFGKIHYFDGIVELKWNSGVRVYTARLDKSIVVVLGGGNKNGQSKDIEKAKKILKKIKNSKLNIT